MRKIAVFTLIALLFLAGCFVTLLLPRFGAEEVFRENSPSRKAPNTLHSARAQSNPEAAEQPPLSEPQGDGTIAGQVITVAGVPQPGAKVSALFVTESSPSIDALAASSVSDETGAFLISHLAEGSYLVSATYNSAIAVGQEMVDVGKRTKPITLILREGGSLAGEVVSSNNKGIPGVRLFPVKRDNLKLAPHEQRLLATTTDSTGRFVFPVLQSRSWQFYLVAEGHAPKYSEAINIGENAAVIQMAPGAVCEGRLTDVGSGEALHGVGVVAQPIEAVALQEKVLTDLQGNFRFDTLAPGKYILRLDDEVLVLKDGTIPVNLDVGEKAFVKLEACPGGTIEGSISNSATKTGLPHIAVLARPKENKVIKSSKRVVSDQQGVYRITGLEFGAYLLRSGTGPVQSPTIEIQLTPQSPVHREDMQLDVGRQIQGKVVYQMDTPAEGVQVLCGGGSSRFGTTSNSDGSFVFSGIPVHERVILSASDGQLQSLPLHVNELSDAELQSLTLELTIPTDRMVTGIVIGETGTPIAVRLNATVDQGSTIVTFQTGEDGLFVLQGLPGGEVSISGSREGSTLVHLANVDMKSEKEVRGLKLEFPGLELGVISGRVATLDDEPVVALVSASTAELGSQTGEYPSAPQVARTSPQGAFEISGLRPGNYKLTVRSPGYSDQVMKNVPTGTKDLFFQLASGPTISGKVQDLSHRPIDKFEIAVTLLENAKSGSLKYSAFKSPEGHFDVPVETDYYYLWVRAKGYSPAEFLVGEVTKAATSRASFTLDRMGSQLKGSVQNAAGEAVSKAVIHLGSLHSPAISHSDGEGQFSLEDLLPGTQELSIFHPKHGSASAIVELVEGVTTEVFVSLTPLGAVEGVLVSDSGPIADAQVTLITFTGASMRVKTAADGVFIFESVPAGRATVTLGEHPDYSRVDRLVEVPPGGKVFVELQAYYTGPPA